RSIRAPGLERDHLASAGIEEAPMGSQAASAHRPGTTWLILLGLVVVLVGSVAWATFAWQSRPVTSQVTEPPAPSAIARYPRLPDAEPSQFEQIRPTVLFLQGVAALRRGETENCVDCQCRTSCILPIQPEAVHQKREGSREAIGFFTEYLQTNPDDVGAQWLL